MRDYKFLSLISGYGNKKRKELFTRVDSNFRNAMVLLYNTFFYYFHLSSYQKQLKSKIWVFNNSINQYNSSKYLREIGNIAFISIRSQKAKHIDLNIFYSVFNIKIKDLSFIIELCRRHQSFNNLIDVLAMTALYRSYVKLIKRLDPKSIILLNDHRLKSKVVLYAGKNSSIKTIYIQHASVTPKFPKLEFDFALLEGEASKNTYLNICKNTQTNIELIGMGKLDEYIASIADHLPKEIKTIGIATNTLDPFEAVLELNNELNKRGIRTIVRPHPADPNAARFHKSFDRVSDSSQEDFATFINQIDLQIAGNSSIHLEAVALRKYSYYYAFKRKKPSDSYGYYESGLIKKFNLGVLDNNDLYFPEKEKIAEYIHGYNFGQTEKAIPKYLKRVDEISNHN